jgi:hypothetical protein
MKGKLVPIKNLQTMISAKETGGNSKSVLANGRNTLIMPAQLILEKSLIAPLMSKSVLSQEYSQIGSEMSGIDDRTKNIKSKLIEMDKMQGRYHSPHLLSLGFIVSKNESPHMNRFLNINRSPEVLSKIQRTRSPSLDGYSPRKDIALNSNCIHNCYDVNIDAVKANPAKPTLDFNRVTARK